MSPTPDQILSDRLTFNPAGLPGTLRLFGEENQAFRVIPEAKITQVEYASPTLLRLRFVPKRYSGEYHTDTGNLFITDNFGLQQRTVRATIKFDNGLMGATP